MTVLSLRLLSFVCYLIVIMNFTSQVTAENFLYFCDPNNRGNYDNNSIYHTNLNNLLFTLTASNNQNGFYMSSYGENSDRVNAIGLCRGDIKPDDCRSCLSDSRATLINDCPNNKEAIGWNEDKHCMLRYSDRSISGLNEILPGYLVWNVNNATSMDQFNRVVKELLDNLRNKATLGDSHSKYAVGTASGPDNQVIYGLVQCTPDLSGPQCDNCLAESIAAVPVCCNNKVGVRIIRPSCYLRFETYTFFYDPTPPPPSPSPSPPCRIGHQRNCHGPHLL